MPRAMTWRAGPLCWHLLRRFRCWWANPIILITHRTDDRLGPQLGLATREFNVYQASHLQASSPANLRPKFRQLAAKTVAALASTMLLAGCMGGSSQGPGYAYQQYDHNRPDPAYGGYDAGRYYRDGPQYRERTLRRNDRVYRGNDGRYYCRRNDGTTGLILGAIAGGVLGNVIAPGDSRTLGTLLGAGGGAVVGRSLGRNDARCR